MAKGETGLRRHLPSATSSPLTSPDGTPSERSRRPSIRDLAHSEPDVTRSSHFEKGDPVPSTLVTLDENRRPSGASNLAAAESLVEVGAELLWGCSNPPTSAELMRIYGTRPLRAQFACDYCRRRKAKCSGTEPCTRCVSKKKECVFSTVRNQRKVTVSLKDIRAGRHAHSVPSSTSRRTSSDYSPSVNCREASEGRRIVASQGSVGATAADYYHRLGKLDRPPRFHTASSQSTPNLPTTANPDTPSSWNFGSPVYSGVSVFHSNDPSMNYHYNHNGWQADGRGWTSTAYSSQLPHGPNGSFGLGLYLDSRYVGAVSANQYADPSTWPATPYIAASPPMPASHFPPNSFGVSQRGFAQDHGAELAPHPASHDFQTQQHSQQERFGRGLGVVRTSVNREASASCPWSAVATTSLPSEISAANYSSDVAGESLGFRPPTPSM